IEPKCVRSDQPIEEDRIQPKCVNHSSQHYLLTQAFRASNRKSTKSSKPVAVSSGDSYAGLFSSFRSQRQRHRESRHKMKKDSIVGKQLLLKHGGRHHPKSGAGISKERSVKQSPF
ncbi:unnamed protein product, partial [Ilex paraguariensis]